MVHLPYSYNVTQYDVYCTVYGLKFMVQLVLKDRPYGMIPPPLCGLLVGRLGKVWIASPKSFNCRALISAEKLDNPLCILILLL